MLNHRIIGNQNRALRVPSLLTSQMSDKYSSIVDSGQTLPFRKVLVSPSPHPIDSLREAEPGRWASRCPSLGDGVSG